MSQIIWHANERTIETNKTLKSMIKRCEYDRINCNIYFKN